MIDFDRFLETLREDLGNALQVYSSEFREEIIGTVSAFAVSLNSDIQKWAQQFQDGELNREDLEFLINARKDRLKLEALRHKGLEQVRIDRLRKEIQDSFIGSLQKML